MRRALLLIAVVLVLLAQRGDAQSVNIAWDASTSDTVIGYRVYRDGAPSNEVIAGLQATVLVVYDTLHTVWVTALNAAGLESIPSNSVTVQVASPPPPPQELCAADGTGNGIDDDGDGVVDEGCLPPPPPPAPTCVTNGVTYPAATVVVATVKNGDADPVIAARTGEGWALLTRKKVRNLTTLTFECRGR